MVLSKSVQQPLMVYLDNWFGSLPFHMLESIFDVSIVGYNSTETEKRLEHLRCDWVDLSLEDKIEIHDQWWEECENWTSHLELPYITFPSGNITFGPTSSFHPYDLYGSDTGDYNHNI